jgi:hypothetical protein
MTPLIIENDILTKNLDINSWHIIVYILIFSHIWILPYVIYEGFKNYYLLRIIQNKFLWMILLWTKALEKFD